MKIERRRTGLPVQWTPFFGIRGLQGDMNALFGDLFGDDTRAELSVLRPAIDVIDGKDKITVKAELPGIEREDIDILLKDELLTISGEKKSETEEKDEGHYYVERSFGTFRRTVTLPAAVRGDEVKAAYRDGVLEIDLPKAEEEQARRFKVDIK
jgi:HSP20 family protein